MEINFTKGWSLFGFFLFFSIHIYFKDYISIFWNWPCFEMQFLFQKFGMFKMKTNHVNRGKIKTKKRDSVFKRFFFVCYRDLSLTFYYPGYYYDANTFFLKIKCF